jgi:ferrous-iron efflux pump FieF
VSSLRWAATISAILALAKGFAFVWTGSVVVLASFLDSFVDTILSFVNFKISKLSQARPDREHPYGHGGFEVLTAMVQGVLIAGSGVLVLFQGIDRIFSPKSIENLTMERLPIALVIMVASTLSAFLITIILQRSRREVQSKDQRSLSLDADYAHYSGDVLQNVVTIAGLALTWWLKTPWADIISGLLAGMILLRAAYPLLRESIRDVMNTEFDPKLREQVQKIVSSSGIAEIRGMHRLRTRTLGPNRFIDFHLKLPNQLPLIQAHEIGYRLEALIKREIPGADVVMHLDPEAEPDDDFY